MESATNISYVQDYNKAPEEGTFSCPHNNNKDTLLKDETNKPSLKKDDDDEPESSISSPSHQVPYLATHPI